MQSTQMFVLLVSPSVNRGIRGGSRVSARPFSQFLSFLIGIISLRGNNWPIEAFGYAFPVSDDSIWACGNMSRESGHNLVFTFFFIRMFKFILYFPLFALFNSLPCFQCS